MLCTVHSSIFFFFFFNDTATTEIYTLSLHDALPIYAPGMVRAHRQAPVGAHAELGVFSARLTLAVADARPATPSSDRKSTRLNSSHVEISYAVFCLKKKKKKKKKTITQQNNRQ